MRLHHVGVVMRNEKAMAQFMELLGLEEDYRGFVAEWQALCVFAKAAPGAVPFEFVIAEAGPLKAFNRGVGGVHHAALLVPDLGATMADLTARGVRLLAPAPVKGAGPFLCNFIDPLYSANALVELVEALPP